MTIEEVGFKLLNKPKPPTSQLWSSPEWLISRIGNNKIPKEWEKFLGE